MAFNTTTISVFLLLTSECLQDYIIEFVILIGAHGQIEVTHLQKNILFEKKDFFSKIFLGEREKIEDF